MTHLSKAYRKGTLLFMRNISKAASSTFLTSITKDMLNIHKHPVLKQCPSCTLHTGEYAPPTRPTAGNRRHYFFFCNNTNIACFRHKATSLLERKLIQPYHSVIRIDPQGGATFLLSGVERSLLDLHTTNVGRLPTLQNDPVPPCNYLTMDTWLQHLQLNSVWAGIRTGVTELAYIFGFQTTLPDDDLDHNATDVVDAILWDLYLHVSILLSFNPLKPFSNAPPLIVPPLLQV